MRLLFLSDYLLTPYGGAQKSAEAHLQSIKALIGNKSVDTVAVSYQDDEENSEYIIIKGNTTKPARLISRLMGNPYFLPEKANQKVIKLIKKNKYDVVFIDNSCFGKIAEYIKKNHPKIRVITNFHGVKHNSTLQRIKVSPLHPMGYFDAIVAIKNEKQIIKYSDVLILLNKRENNMLKKYYHKSADYLLPVYFVDTAEIEEPEDDGKFHILFVGGGMWANIIGIRWFISNVMPMLDEKVCLDIVGNKMEQLFDDRIEDSRIHIYGRVDSLHKYYNMANLVIGPIFHGDGMKTKTAEALMYGKFFAGTDEALCGYEELDLYHCNEAEEFAEVIEYMEKKKTPKFSGKMRKLFEEKHSLKMAEEIFKKALGMIK